jgi:hypothetical protein
MLCQSCLSIFDCRRVHGKKVLQRGSHVICLRGVQLSGRAGCPLCAQLYRKLKCSIVPANESEEDFWLTSYYLYYRMIENGSFPDSFNLAFRLSTKCLPEDAILEDIARDTIICTHEFKVASSNSKYRSSHRSPPIGSNPLKVLRLIQPSMASIIQSQETPTAKKHGSWQTSG